MGRSRGWLPLVLAFAAIIGGNHNRALAGPIEHLSRLVFHPIDPMTFVIAYTEAGGGMLVTHDGGTTFKLVCASAVLGELSLGTGQVSSVVTADGHILVGRFGGLLRGDGDGCAFTVVEGFAGKNVTDVVLDPDDPSTIFALTSTGGQQNGLYRSNDNGASFALVGRTDTDFFQRLLITKLADGRRRFYQSLARSNDGGTATYSIRSSVDEGETWTEHTLQAGAYYDFRLLGVDRLSPDRIYAAATPATAETQTIVVNSVAGDATQWNEVLALPEVASFLPLREGGFVAVEGPSGSMFQSTPTGESAVAVASTPAILSCVAESPLNGQRYACATWQLYLASPQGQIMGQPILDLNTVESFSDCQSDVAGICEVQLNAGWCGVTHFPTAPMCQKLPYASGNPPAQPEGNGTLDAGVLQTKPSSSCSLVLGGRNRGNRFDWASLVLLLGALARYRARQRSDLLCAATLALATACGNNPAESGESDEDQNDASAEAGTPADADLYSPGMSKLGQAEKLAVRLLESLPGPPEQGNNRWRVGIELPNGQPAPEASVVRVEPYMPEHGHGTSVQAIVTELQAPSTFDVQQVNLRMPKLWEVRMTVRSGSIEDLVVFKFWIQE